MRNPVIGNISKKTRIFFLLVLLLGLTNGTFAQVTGEERCPPPVGELPQEQNQQVINYEDEIKKEELPGEVTGSLEKTYPSFAIKEIFRGSDGSYKVTLEKKDKNIAAYYDAAGEFLRVEEDHGEDTMNDDWR